MYFIITNLIKVFVVAGLCSIIYLTTSCARAPTSADFINSCKQACRGTVQYFEDDLIKCECKAHSAERK